MERFVRCSLQSLLKLVNSVIGLVGMGLILYALWMLRLWYREVHNFWAAGPDSIPPWFIYTFLGLGVLLCMITCSGHVSAENANGCSLSCYMIFVFLLIMLEAAITADVILNKDWEEDFPEDPTGRFNEFKDFVRSNFEMSKWIAVAVVASQGTSFFLAMILRAIGPYPGNHYGTDDYYYIPARVPLLRNQVQQPPFDSEAHPSLKNDYWNVRAYFNNCK